jgi:NADPH:quinone reductase-like Zn-dependent oxidoreductase
VDEVDEVDEMTSAARAATAGTTAGTTMRAAVCERYGPPEAVRITTLPAPTPRPGDVLVRVLAAAVTSGDARMRAARFPRGFGIPGRLALGIRGPRRAVLGSTFAGVIEQVGDQVTDRAVGDMVCGMTGMALGTHAELVRVPAARAVPVPPGVSAVDAAGLLFGGTTALHYLRTKGALRAGMSVLVNGASGALGTNAVQLAAAAGATVTAVTSARNADLVTGLGATRVIDHTTTDVTALDDRFDLVFDAVGTITRRTGRRLLTDRGVLLLTVASLADTVRTGSRVKAGPAPERPEEMAELLQMHAAGRLRVVLDQVLPFDEIVTAHRIVDSGRKRGNVVVVP